MRPAIAALALLAALAGCGEEDRDGFPRPVPVAASLDHPTGLRAPLPVGFAIAETGPAGYRMAEIGAGADARDIEIAMADEAPFAVEGEGRWLPAASRNIHERIVGGEAGWEITLWRAERQRWLIVRGRAPGEEKPEFRAAWTVFGAARPGEAAGPR